MNGEKDRFLSPLAEAEMEVLQEGREWMRQRLEEKLGKIAARDGGFSPLERKASGSQAQASSEVDGKCGKS